MKNYTFLLLAGIVLFSGACKKKDETNLNYGDYVVALRTQGSEGTSDYLVQKTNITSNFSAEGVGIEQLGWCYYAHAGNTILSFAYDNFNKCIGYTKDANGRLVEKGSFAFDRMDFVEKVDDNTLVGIGAPWGGGTKNCEIQVIDASSMSISKSKITQLYNYSKTDDLNKWPTSATVRDGKLFVAFYPVVGATWETNDVDTAFVTIYDYPSLDSVKTIKSTKFGPIGYYGGQPCVLKDEYGNLYTISTASVVGGFTKRTKHSGILKISSGTTEFDPNYSIDADLLANGRLLNGVYAGNGKIVARFVSNTNDVDYITGSSDPNWWKVFDTTQDIVEIVIVDVNAKTITKVTDVPLHGGQYQTPYYVENGKVYISVSNQAAGEVRVYEVDPTNATAKKGPVVEGVEFQGLFKL